jgi:hypothetical protein
MPRQEKLRHHIAVLSFLHRTVEEQLALAIKELYLPDHWTVPEHLNDAILHIHAELAINGEPPLAEKIDNH